MSKEKANFTPESKDIVRLMHPSDASRYGQGSMPEALRITKNGESYELPFGADYKVSSHCDPDNRIGSLDSKGDLPLIRTEFVEQHINQFKLITKYKEE